MQDSTANTSTDLDAPTPTLIDTKAETDLSAEIAELWGKHKNGQAEARRTRAELKALRLQLGEKLHTMKALLVRTGRGGGWAAYLRSQKLPIATADKYVAEHAASLISPEEKLLKEELSKPAVDQIRQVAKKMAGKFNDILTTQELVYEFVHEFVWNIDAAEAWSTDNGFELREVESDEAPEVDAPAGELANHAPVVP